MSYHDLTLHDIAGATRNAVSTVGTWRNGRVPSSRHALAKLAEIFHVQVEYLLTGEIPPGGPGPLAQAAGRVLDDVADLLRALDAEAAERKLALAEEPVEISPGGSPKSIPDGAPKPRLRGAIRRQEVESYVKSFLDHAERAPGGLAHAWVQLRREFPLDLHERLRG
jgi:transcriptional regulator with XRE-family HTH domain